MMSTGLVMAISAEQTGMRSKTSDRAGGEEIAFAQSFGERVAGLSADVDTKNAAGEAVNDLQEKAATEHSKNVEGSGAPYVGGKGSTTEQEAAVLHDEKTVVSSPVPRAVVPSDKRSITIVEQLPAKGTELQGAEARDAIAVSVAQAKSIGQSAEMGDDELSADKEEGAVDLRSVQKPQESAAVSTRSSTSIVAHKNIETAIQNETMLSEKTNNAASITSSAKTAEETGRPKATQKTVEVKEKTKGVDASNGAMSIAQGLIPMPILGDGQQSSEVKPSEDSSDTVSATTGKTAAAVWTVAHDSGGSIQIVRPGKDAGEEMKDAVVPSTGQTVSGSSGDEMSKTETVAVATGKVGEDRSRAVVATVPREAGSEGAGVGVSVGVLSVSTSGSVTRANVQRGDVPAYTAGLHAGSGDQDGPGTGAVEMPASHRTLLATPTSLEVGISNGTQGWLKIRAEMAGGGVVNASLTPTTVAGQEMLHRDLPALTAYLHQERVAVNAVTVNANAASTPESRLAAGTDGSGGGQAQGDSHKGGEERGALVSEASDTAGDKITYMGLDGVGEDGLLSSASYTGGGSWLNVRA